MLTISEKLLLLALHDEKGHVLMRAESALPYSLAGAALIELVMQNKIRLDGRHVQIADGAVTGNAVYDYVLGKIRESKKPKDIKHWVRKIGEFPAPLKKMLTEQLTHKGILRIQKQKILWLFALKRYPMRNPVPETDVRQHLQQVVLYQGRPSETDVILLSLVKVCDLIPEIFEKDQRKEAKKRIKELIEGEKMGKLVKDIVDESMAAVVVAVSAATAATAASS